MSPTRWATASRRRANRPAADGTRPLGPASVRRWSTSQSRPKSPARAAPPLARACPARGTGEQFRRSGMSACPPKRRWTKLPLPALRHQVMHRCDIRRKTNLPRKNLIRIDGEFVSAARRPDHPRGGARQRQVHPNALLPGGHHARGRLPAVHRGGLGSRPPAARLHHSGAGRHVASPPTPTKLAHYRRIALEFLFPSAITFAPCASPTITASCRPWRSALGVTTCAMPTTFRAAGGPVAPALCAGSQSLHPVYALRPGVRGSGRRARVGRRFARHPLA